MSKVDGYATLLTRVGKDLAANWGAAKVSWRDARSRAFEASCVDELLGQLGSAAAAAGSLGKLLGKIRSDCE